MATWATAGIFPEWGKLCTGKNGLLFSAPKARTKIFAIFFTLESFGVFCMDTAYDIIIFKLQGGGQLPQVDPPPLSPMDVDTLTIRCRIGVVIDKSHDDYFTQRH